MTYSIILLLLSEEEIKQFINNMLSLIVLYKKKLTIINIIY